MSIFDFQAHDLVRVLAALVIGSLIGGEREYRSKAAGFRTMTICVGAAVFTMLSLRLGAGGSPDRIASNVITGIGWSVSGAAIQPEWPSYVVVLSPLAPCTMMVRSSGALA